MFITMILNIPGQFTPAGGSGFPDALRLIWFYTWSADFGNQQTAAGKHMVAGAFLRLTVTVMHN